VQWANPAPQTPVWAFPLTDASAQHWAYDPAAKTIKNESNLCLEAKNGGSANGTPVWMNSCNSGAAQQWTLVNYAPDKLGLKNASGRCLDAPFGANQLALQLWDCGATIASGHTGRSLAPHDRGAVVTVAGPWARKYASLAGNHPKRPRLGFALVTGLERRECLPLANVLIQIRAPPSQL